MAYKTLSPRRIRPCREPACGKDVFFATVLNTHVGPRAMAFDAEATTVVTLSNGPDHGDSEGPELIATTHTGYQPHENTCLAHHED